VAIPRLPCSLLLSLYLLIAQNLIDVAEVYACLFTLSLS